MATAIPRGVVPVVAVAFHDDGGLDVNGFAAIVDHVLATGVDGCLMFGLASEFPTLDDAERFELLEVLVERAAMHPDFTIIASVTDHGTYVAERRAREYVQRGATAINVLPPHFLSPSAAAVFEHLERVLAAVDVPVVVQYAPAQTGTSLAASDLVELATRHSNLAAVKVESNPPDAMIAQLRDAGIASLVGQGGLHLPAAHAAGAVGVQPGCSLIPLYQQMWAAAEAGDLARFSLLHRELLPVISHWMTSVPTIVAAEKLVLQRVGVIESHHCRQPSGTLDRYSTHLVDRAIELLAGAVPVDEATSL